VNIRQQVKCLDHQHVIIWLKDCMKQHHPVHEWAITITISQMSTDMLKIISLQKTKVIILYVY